MKMTEFHSFDEGRNFVNAGGLPAVCHFLLSTKAVADFTAKDTLEGGVGEITGTGYERVSQISPGWWPPWQSPSYVANFDRVEWKTLTAQDWPSAVRSMVLVAASQYGSRNDEVAVGAWNLRDGGLPRDFSKQFVSEKLYPVLQIFNPTLPKAGTST